MKPPARQLIPYAAAGIFLGERITAGWSGGAASIRRAMPIGETGSASGVRFRMI
jgi:hypothetical protein